jgi:hypothetical protein
MSRSAAKVERLWRRISISPVVEVGDEPDTPDEVNWSTGPKLLKDCSALVLAGMRETTAGGIKADPQHDRYTMPQGFHRLGMAQAHEPAAGRDQPLARLHVSFRR